MPNGGNNASITETDESRLRRRGTEKLLSESEQRNLSRSTGKQVKSTGFVQSNEERAQTVSKV